VERDVITRSVSLRRSGGGPRLLSDEGLVALSGGRDDVLHHTFYTSSRTDPAGGYLPSGNTNETPTNRVGVFLQDKVRLGNVTVSAGLRYDREDVRDWSNTTLFRARQRVAAAARRCVGPAEGRLDARFRLVQPLYLRLPLDINVRAFGNDLIGLTYNFSPTSIVQDPLAPRLASASGGVFSEPIAPASRGCTRTSSRLASRRRSTGRSRWA